MGASMMRGMSERARVMRVVVAAGLLAASIAMPHARASAGEASAGEARGPVEVDVELVIAADVSTSMDRTEKQLQRDGFVAAFRDPDFIRAVERGLLGRIAVTYVEWGGAGRARVVLPWSVIDGTGAAFDFASRLAGTFPGRLTGGTAAGDALAFSARLFEGNGIEATRRVIDLSGDGVSNRGTPVEIARRAVLDREIVINGLPIVYPRPLDTATGGEEDWPPDVLIDYYNREIIGGPGAFVEPVTEVGMYADAIRRKLIREVAEEAPLGTLASQP